MSQFESTSTAPTRVRTLEAGTQKSTRPNLNFVSGNPSTTVSVTDNPGLNRTDITISASGSGEGMYDLEADFVTPTLCYRGDADPGSSVANPVWRIRKVVIDEDASTTHITWASGNANLDKKWTDRLTYTYS